MTRRELRKGPISWMARNPVAANLVMFSLIVGGLLMSRLLRKEVFPVTSLDQVVVSVPYPGASPAEVEQGIVLAVEEAVRGLDQVKHVRSSAAEGLAAVVVELEDGANTNKALSDVKNAVDRITTLPEEAERPQVSLPEIKVEAINVVLYGDQEQQVLRALAESVRQQLLALPEVTSVELAQARGREIGVEIPRDVLREQGLTLEQVASRVRQAALELPGGGVKSDGGEVLLRTTERRDLGHQFADIPLLTTSDGRVLRLGQLAQIGDGFAETDTYTTFNGHPALVLKVSSTGDQSPTEVGQAVKDFTAQLSDSLPGGVSLATWNDMTEIFSDRVDLLMRNSALGLALVLLILGLFLEPKLAFWVSMGIPVSFLGALFLMPAFDISINMISLFAFIVTLGMVVDDAIVVGENVHHLRQRGTGRLQAAIQGAREMATPIFFSIATTVVAFAPLLFMPGTHGKLASAIPILVILVLLISLAESFFVLPAHLAHMRQRKSVGLLGWLLGLQRRFSAGFERFVEWGYGPLVDRAVRHRWITVALSISVFLVTIGLITGGRIKFVDFPKEEADRVTVQAELPYGAPAQECRAVAQRLVTAAKQAMQQTGEPGALEGILAAVGGRAVGGRPLDQLGSVSSNVISVTVALVPSDRRRFSGFQLIDQWRAKLGPLPGLQSISFSSSIRGSQKPVDIELSHPRLALLEGAAMEVARRLEQVKGVYDVDNGVERGKPQLDFTLTPDGEAAGLTALSLGSQVRAAFYGAEALRQQRGRDEVKVVVRLPRAERESLATVESMMVRTPSGGEMPLRQAARVRHGRSYTTIQRIDGRRYLRVQADVDETKANPREVTAALVKKDGPELRQRFPGLVLGSAGRQEEMEEFFSFMAVGFTMALIAIFALLAVPLKSYLQPPLVVMMAIPFGFVGAVLGHAALGMDLTMFSMMGVVALAGVVVNDSIVLVTTANQLREQGASAEEAATQASRRRLRPILLTTLTTFGGLAPMIFETSFQARILVPMAVSLGCGIMVATLFVLLLVPALYVLTENLRDRLRRLRAAAVEDLATAEDAP